MAEPNFPLGGNGKTCLYCGRPADFVLEIISAGYPVVCYFCTEHSQWVFDHDYMVVSVGYTKDMERAIRESSPAASANVLPSVPVESPAEQSRTLWRWFLSVLIRVLDRR